MSGLHDMAERLAERRELEQLREENARLRRELEEERNPVLRMARSYRNMDMSHPEIVAHYNRMAHAHVPVFPTSV